MAAGVIDDVIDNVIDDVISTTTSATTSTLTSPVTSLAKAFTKAIEEFTPPSCIKFKVGTKEMLPHSYNYLMNGLGNQPYTLKAGDEAFILIMKLYRGSDSDNLATVFCRVEMQPNEQVIVDWRRTFYHKLVIDNKFSRIIGSLEYDSMSLALAGLVDRAISAGMVGIIGDKTKSAARRAVIDHEHHP